MERKFSRRTLIRTVSFTLAIMLALLASNLVYMKKLKVSSNIIEASHRLALSELSQSSDKIYSALEKTMCSASAPMLMSLSAEVLEQAANAKNSLMDLPLSNQELENTEKFLSQVGNYSRYLAELSQEGNISYKDYLTLGIIRDHAKSLRDKLYALESAMLTSDQNLSELFEALGDGSIVVDGLSGLEDSFAEMPKLIYDGPYSDHILEKEPTMTQNAKEVSVDTAKKKAARVAGVDEWKLTEQTPEEGKMPSYRFTGDGISITVTKAGGYLSYMLKSRTVTETKISVEDALDKAEDYMELLGIEDMESTYYECYNNVLTVNFAYEQDSPFDNEDIICYTDLIKITVALDNGEILGFDCRGYLVNHRDRDFQEIKVNRMKAQGKLSPHLRVRSSQLALIPTDNVDETLCYEFLCVTEQNKEVLVYVNVQTGEEEDILIILKPENGVLAV